MAKKQIDAIYHMMDMMLYFSEQMRQELEKDCPSIEKIKHMQFNVSGLIYEFKNIVHESDYSKNPIMIEYNE